MNTPRWSESPELAEVWTDPCDWLPRLQARTDAILATLHAANAERADLVVIDHGAAAAWLDTASRDFDVDQEGAA